MNRENGGGIRIKTVATEFDVYFDMALTMLETILKNNAEHKKTVMIVPVGPTGQYPIFAELVNRLRVPLGDVHFFNMDEYLETPDRPIAKTHPMSFAARMDDALYDRLDPTLTVPENQRHFPQPGREAEYDALLDRLGGAALCLGGLGINGHLAFNEPPEAGEKITPEAFAALPTRVLPIARETRTVNAIGYQRGDICGMPEWCVTVGMKQILASRAVYIALNREWQHGIAKRVLTGPVSASVPASLLRRHPDVRFTVSASIADGLPGVSRESPNTSSARAKMP